MSILDDIQKAMDLIGDTPSKPEPFNPMFSFGGYKIIEQPDIPKLQVTKETTSYTGFKWISDEARAKTNAWLAEMFGYTEAVPRDSVYMFHDTIIIRPEHAAILKNIVA